MTRSFSERTIGIVDYQAGNIQSIENAFAYLDATTKRVRSESDFAKCTHVVLPGVGAFGFCLDKLNASGLLDGLRHWTFDRRQPLLGICVGMQLLAAGSEETPDARGLDWIGGAVRLIPVSDGVRVPHVGWNAVEFPDGYGEFAPGASVDFYFDHSFAYHEPRQGTVLGRARHGVDFCAVVQSDNITAAQFHPEKSQSPGMRFLRTFLSS